MRINYDHDNRRAPKGVFGGALCLCHECRLKRGEITADVAEGQKRIDRMIDLFTKKEASK